MARDHVLTCPDCGSDNLGRFTTPVRNKKRPPPAQGAYYCRACWSIFCDPTECETCRMNVATHIARHTITGVEWRVCIRCVRQTAKHDKPSDRIPIVCEPIA